MSTTTARWLTGTVLALDCVVLRWVGLGWGTQLTLASVLAVWVFAGRFLLALVPGDELDTDRTGELVVASLVGFALHAGVAFVLFHTAVMRLLGLDGVRSAALLAFALLVALALAGATRSRRVVSTGVPAAAPALLLVASLVAGGSAFGFMNNEAEVHVKDWLALPAEARPPLPNWGGTYYRFGQFWGGTLASLGFPAGFPNGHTSHRGIETILTAVDLLGSEFSVMHSAAVTKAFCLFWLFTLLSGAFALARRLGGAPGTAFLAALGTVLLAAVNVHAFREPETSLRILPLAGTLYYNVTQQVSLALGLAGLLLCFQDVARARRAFVFGCGLVAASFFFKPSLYSVVMPPLALVPLWRAEPGHRRFVIAGLVVGASAAVVWVLYPPLVGIPTWAVPVGVAFLEIQKGKVASVVPWPVAGPVTLFLSIVVLGYLGYVIPLAFATARIAARGRDGMVAALRAIDPAALVLVLAFLLGQVSGFFLFEDGWKKSHGNYLWGLAIGALLLLPVVVREIARLPRPGLRALAWTLYAAQLLSGAWNLWVFARWGVLYSASTL